MHTPVMKTQGMLALLAYHAGIHLEIPPYPARLASYHEALMAYDEAAPNNNYHKSVATDGLNVAKTLRRGTSSFLRHPRERVKGTGLYLNSLEEIDVLFARAHLEKG